MLVDKGACSVAELCLTFCGPMDSRPPGSTVHGISQARKLERVVNSFSRGLPHPGIEPASPALASGSFTTKPPEIMFSVKGLCVQQQKGLCSSTVSGCTKNVAKGSHQAFTYPFVTWESCQPRLLYRIIVRIKRDHVCLHEALHKFKSSPMYHTNCTSQTQVTLPGQESPKENFKFIPDDMPQSFAWSQS